MLVIAQNRLLYFPSPSLFKESQIISKSFIGEQFLYGCIPRPNMRSVPTVIAFLPSLIFLSPPFRPLCPTRNLS